MTKKEFKKCMKEIVSLNEDLDNVNKALRKFDHDFNFLCFSRYQELILDLLNRLMKDENDWIGYWIYELDYGKEAKNGSVTKNGKNIPIKTIDNLYDVITK